MSAAFEFVVGVDLAFNIKIKNSRPECTLTPDSPMVAIKNFSHGVTFAIRVHPRAKKNAITGEVGEALKVSLTAPPADGKANQACIDLFAKLLEAAPFLHYYCSRPDQPQ